jgi:hypothetical protein
MSAFYQPSILPITVCEYRFHRPMNAHTSIHGAERKQIRLPLALSFITARSRPVRASRSKWRGSNSGSIRFLGTRGFGHARLRHFLLDGKECRFAGFFLGFLPKHATRMTWRPKQYSTIWNSANNPSLSPLEAAGVKAGQKLLVRRGYSGSIISAL